MHVGVLELELRLHGCRSLKEKRSVVRSLIDRLRHTFGASVAEVDGQNEWQRAVIGAAIVSGDRLLVERFLNEMIDFAEAHAGAEIVAIGTEIVSGSPTE